MAERIAHVNWRHSLIKVRHLDQKTIVLLFISFYYSLFYMVAFSIRIECDQFSDLILLLLYFFCMSCCPVFHQVYSSLVIFPLKNNFKLLSMHVRQFPSSLPFPEWVSVVSLHYVQIVWIPHMDGVYTAQRRCGIEWLQAPSSVALSAEMNTEFTYRRTYVWSMLHLGKGCNVFDGGRRVWDRQLCTLEVTKSGNSMYQRL